MEIPVADDEIEVKPSKTDLVATMPSATLLIEDLRKIVTDSNDQVAWLKFVRSFLGNKINN